MRASRPLKRLEPCAKREGKPQTEGLSVGALRAWWWRGEGGYSKTESWDPPHALPLNILTRAQCIREASGGQNRKGETAWAGTWDPRNTVV